LSFSSLARILSLYLREVGAEPTRTTKQILLPKGSFTQFSFSAKLYKNQNGHRNPLSKNYGTSR
jgi:hypothetical protein